MLQIYGIVYIRANYLVCYKTYTTKKIGYPRRPPTLSHEKFKSLTLINKCMLNHLSNANIQQYSVSQN